MVDDEWRELFLFVFDSPPEGLLVLLFSKKYLHMQVCYRTCQLSNRPLSQLIQNTTQFHYIYHLSCFVIFKLSKYNVEIFDITSAMPELDKPLLLSVFVCMMVLVYRTY